MNRKRIVGFIAVFLICTSLKAQSNEPVTLNGIINKALDYYPRLKEQKLQIDLSEIKTEITHSQLLPNIHGEATYNHLYPDSYADFGGANRISFYPLDQWNAGIRISQLLYNFGRGRAEVDKTKSEKKLAESFYKSTSFDFAYQIANVYNNIIFLNKSIEAIDAQIIALSETVKIIGFRIQNGVAIEFDLVSTQVKLNDALNQKTELQNALQKQIILLNTLSGTSLTKSSIPFKKFDYSLTEHSLDSVFYVSQVNNPELSSAKFQQEAASNELRVTKKNWAPSLLFIGGTGYKNGFFPGDIYKLKFNYSVGAALTVPIYAGGKNDNEHNISKLNYKASQYNLDEVTINLKKDIEKNLTDERTAKQKLIFSATQIDQAQKAFDLANSRFKNGVITNIELLDAHSNLLKAKVDQIQFEYQLATTQLDLNRLMGTQFWIQ